MSEVKTQGAPVRIFVSHGRSDERGEEYIRADIARELAEALERIVKETEYFQAEYVLAAKPVLAKWREAQEEGS